MKRLWVLIISLIVFTLVQSSLSAQNTQGLTPEQTYIIYLKCFQAGNFEAYKSYVDKKILEKIEQSTTQVEPEKVMQMLKFIAPRNVKIIDSKITTQKAVLKATGELPGATTPAKGAIVLIKENGQWKVSAEKWVAKSANGSGEQSFSMGLD